MVILTSFSITTKTSELGIWFEKRLVRPAGSRKNSPTANTSANAIVPAQAPPPMSCCSPSASGGICALAEMPRARKPILSDSASATTPRTIGTRSSRWRFVQETSGSEITSMSPFAPSFESAPPASSCRAEGLRTATAQVEMPRIITPSSTAWPPIGASVVASRGRSGELPFMEVGALTALIVSALRPSASMINSAPAEIQAAQLVRVVRLGRLGDHLVGVRLHAYELLTVRAPDDHRPGLAAAERQRDGVHHVAIDAEPHGHRCHWRLPGVGHPRLVAHDPWNGRSRDARDPRRQVRQREELAAARREPLRARQLHSSGGVPAEVDPRAVAGVLLEVAHALAVAEREHAGLRPVPAAEALRLHGLVALHAGALEQRVAEGHPVGALHEPQSRGERGGMVGDGAVQQADAPGACVNGSSRRRRHEGGGRHSSCEEPATRTCCAAAEALDAATGVHELLTARVEGVAVRADLDVELRLGRTRPELVTARAAH